MARLGSKKRPVRVRVQGERGLLHVERLCHEHGFEFIAELAPEQPEDFDELEQALDPSERVAHEPIRRSINIGRNDPCLCGSGVKFKKCCANKPSTTP